jgi:DNA-binding response OmpR family regulator
VVRILVLADDLIWATRLAGHVRACGAEPAPVRASAPFRDALASADGAIVDLTSLAYDGLAEIGAAREAGVRVLAVGQHDDHDLRRQAIAAGADRVLAYRKLFDDGPATIARWLSAPHPTEATR